jgi:lipoprotein-anchoring transpeptidase ErfK/SrfK
MKRIALVLALAGSCVLATSAPTPALALETYEAQMKATDAATQASFDMFEAFGFKHLKPGQYLWRNVPESAGPERVVIGLSDQLAYLYRGDTLVAVATISTGRFDKPSPTGIFSVLDKKPFYRSKKYGIALHGGYNPGYPASHGCIRLPLAFAKKLYSLTSIGTPVYIGA